MKDRKCFDLLKTQLTVLLTGQLQAVSDVHSPFWSTSLSAVRADTRSNSYTYICSLIHCSSNMKTYGGVEVYLHTFFA